MLVQLSTVLVVLGSQLEVTLTDASFWDVLQTNELYQLASVAFCLLVAWVRFSSSHLNPLGFKS